MAASSHLIGVFTVMRLVALVESIRSNHYWPYDFYVPTLKCQGVSGKPTFLQCAVKCVHGCQAFRYDTGCTICSSGQALNLTFTSDTYYLPRSHRVSGSPGSEVTIQLSQPLSVGNVIHLSLTVLSTTTALNFYSYRPSTLVFHFVVRLDKQRVAMNSMDSGIWGAEENVSSSPYFDQGLKTDIHILVGQDRYVIYFNRNYCCSFMHRLSIAEVSSLYVGENVHVHELSV